ncbi:DUF2911 domain-containing protein [soil metagenome]
MKITNFVHQEKSTMKKIFLILLTLVSLSSLSQAQSLKTPAPSPGQTIKQDFALGSIEVSYSRPSVKGRMIFGDIVPYGEVWRTGANSATTITFSDEVMINGTKVAAGKYGLLSIPGASEWVLILSKNTTITNGADYKKEEDVLRVVVKPQMMITKVETFMINFNNIKSNSCDLQLVWDNMMISMPISADIDSRIMKDIDKMVVNDSRPYFAAATYYMENGKDLNKALEWFGKAADANPKAYWILHQKANCYAKLGMKKEAIATAEKSIEIAKADNDSHYVMLNEKLIKTLK